MPESPDAEPPDTRRDVTEGAKSYVYYSGLAFQMIGILLAFHFGGDALARWLGTEGALFKAATMLVGVALSLYVPLRALMK